MLTNCKGNAKGCVNIGYLFFLLLWMTVSSCRVYQDCELTYEGSTWNCYDKNDEPTGLWILFEDGHKENEIMYKNGKWHGIYKSFYDTGELNVIASYKQGKLHGQYITYAKRGWVFSYREYKNGESHGKYMLYLPDKKEPNVIQLVTKGHYKNGKKTGKWMDYSVDGGVFEYAVIYKEGVAIDTVYKK